MTPQSSGLYAVDDVEAMAQRLEQYAPGLNAAAMLRSQAERIAALEAENARLASGSLLRPSVVMSGPFTDKQIADGAEKLAALKHPPTRTRWYRCDDHAWLAQEPCPVCQDALDAALEGK